MNSETLQEFIQQAENYLSIIRASILVCLQNGSSLHELSAAPRQTKIIKEKAARHGLTNIERVAAGLEKELKLTIAGQITFSEEHSHRLLDSLAVLEARLTETAFDAGLFPADLSDFVEDSFENLQIKHFEQAKDEPVSETIEEPEEEFEIDEEMLEIFAMEAEELLQNIKANLKILEENPNNREALLEVRRSAHTLKGSAGIIGLKKLSGLAHRVEDLLDYLAENEIEANEKIFELLLASTDCFSALAGNENSPQVAKKIARIYENFDEILASFKNKKNPESLISQFQTSNQEGKEQRTDKAKNAENQRQKIEDRSHNSKSVVRISLEKLDELITLVGDLAISRSVFERHLLELERQYNELRHNTSRLQRSTGKLEAEFEGDAMHFSHLALTPLNSKNFHTEPKQALETNSSYFSSDFDALEFDRYTDFHQTTRELVETVTDTYAINVELDVLKDHLEILFDNQRRLVEEMQEKLLHLRLIKFGALSARFQRTVQFTCDEEGKLADLFIEGENQEFDTQILDSLVEPLLHLLRNAVAHGIETPETRRLLGKNERGKILLSVQSEETHVNLTVSDDGRGISAASLIEKALQNNLISREEAEKLSDEDAFSLMFLPGLTTADKLSQVAGRGVGMNIVKTNILRQQGTISVTSGPQKGATFTVRLPLALALTRALIVKTSEQIFAFPSKSIKQIAEIPIKTIAQNPRPKFVPINRENFLILYLDEILRLPATPKKGAQQAPVLILENLEKPSVLSVDEIVGIEEIVIKPLGFPLQNSPGFLGATILGDGRVVPVLDLIYLLKNQVSGSRLQVSGQDSFGALSLSLEKTNLKPETLNLKLTKTVLIVDDSPTVRHLTSKLIKCAGWQPITAKDGLEALEMLQASQELPDVILTDVEMPRMNGYELLSALKRDKKLSRIPVVMITSRSGKKHWQKAVDLGAAEYLTKPFEDSLLVEKIKILQ